MAKNVIKDINLFTAEEVQEIVDEAHVFLAMERGPLFTMGDIVKMVKVVAEDRGKLLVEFFICSGR